MDRELLPLDRRIVNSLQGGIEVSSRPFAAVARELEIDEASLIARLQALLESGVLSRFGPLFNAERLGGGFTLAAIAVPEERFDEVAALVNGFEEVAHNYRREHVFNMWFVVGTESPGRIPQVLAEIERRTGLPVLDLPKEEEFFLELKLTA